MYLTNVFNIIRQSTDLVNALSSYNQQAFLPFPNDPPFSAEADYSLNDPLTHMQILKLIQFYNELFTILQTDGVEVHQVKVKRWHTI